MTIKDLLDQGYTFADEYKDFISNMYDKVVDYNAEVCKLMHDPVSKTINGVPTLPDLTPESIEIQYIFDQYEVVSGEMRFAQDHFTFPIDDLPEELVFEYTDFADSIKEKNRSYGTFTEATLILTFRNSKSQEVTLKAHYYPASFKNSRAECYTGTEEHLDGSLVALTSNLLMYHLYDIEDLKARVQDRLKP